MEMLLSLIPGGGLTAFFGGLLAVLAAVTTAFFRGRKAERTTARAKEADAYEQHLKEISGAHDARNRIDPDRLPDNDRYRRD